MPKPFYGQVETLTGDLRRLVDAYNASGRVACVTQRSRTIRLDGGPPLSYAQALQALQADAERAHGGKDNA